MLGRSAVLRGNHTGDAGKLETTEDFARTYSTLAPIPVLSIPGCPRRQGLGRAPAIQSATSERLGTIARLDDHRGFPHPLQAHAVAIAAWVCPSGRTTCLGSDPGRFSAVPCPGPERYGRAIARKASAVSKSCRMSAHWFILIPPPLGSHRPNHGTNEPPIPHPFRNPFHPPTDISPGNEIGRPARISSSL